MAGAVALLVLAVFGIAAIPRQVGEIVAPPASDGATSQGTAEDSDAQRYLDALDPYLSVVIGEGKRLAELGNARSRNVLELSVRMDRFREASADLQIFISTHEPPETLKGMVTELSDHLADANEAIDASIAAIRGFDWESLGTSVGEFTAAIASIDNLKAARNG